MDRTISCVKVINKLRVKKIKYISYYYQNKIYHRTKIYFYKHNHIYYSNKPSDIGVGDLINLTYIQYKDDTKRYLKSITFHQYYIQK